MTADATAATPIHGRVIARTAAAAALARGRANAVTAAAAVTDLAPVNSSRLCQRDNKTTVEGAKQVSTSVNQPGLTNACL